MIVRLLKIAGYVALWLLGLGVLGWATQRKRR